MLNRNRGPLTYRQCRQTVTVYHREGNAIRRAIFHRAFLECKKTQNVDKTGRREANSFLLVLPTDTPVVFVGDKVLPGEGPEVTMAEWGAFIPAKVPGLLVVQYADDKYYGTQMVHQEAGG